MSAKGHDVRGTEHGCDCLRPPTVTMGQWRDLRRKEKLVIALEYLADAVQHQNGSLTLREETGLYLALMALGQA